MESQTFADIFADYEEKRLAQSRAEIAKEDAAWEALPQSEKDRIMAEREAKFAAMADAESECDESDEEDWDDHDV